MERCTVVLVVSPPLEHHKTMDGEQDWVPWPHNDIKNRKYQEIMAKNKEKEKTGGGNASVSPAGPRDRYFFVYFARWAWARAKTLRMSTARVMGPTPPGTGVI